MDVRLGVPADWMFEGTDDRHAVSMLGQFPKRAAEGHARSAGEVLPGGNLVYGWEINDFLSTAGQTQLNRQLDDGSGDPYVEFSQSWTVAYSLSDCLGAYTEWYTLVPDGANEPGPSQGRPFRQFSVEFSECREAAMSGYSDPTACLILFHIVISRPGCEWLRRPVGDGSR